MILPIINACGFAFSIFANVLAMIPLFGLKSTKQVSDDHKTSITPHRYTFLIWIVIYLFQLAFIIYSFIIYPSVIVDKIGYWFLVACLLNGAWVFAWGYERIPLSVVIIITYLFCVANIYFLIGVHYFTDFNVLTSLFFFTPFSILFAWLMVATILNILSILNYGMENVDMNVQNEWIGFSMIILLSMITVLIGSYKNDFVFVLTFIMAVFGILAENYNRPKIVAGVLVVLILTPIYLIQYILSKFIL